MGYAANFFFRTSQVISIIMNAERIHTLDFQLGIEKFYEYLTSGDSTLLNEGIVHIEKANLIAGTFG